MLAIFESHEHVIVCEVDSEGQPLTGDFFKKGSGISKDDYDFSLVEGPVEIRNRLNVGSERTLTR